MENKNPTIGVLKGVAIMLVVFGHVIQRIMVLAGQDFYCHPVFKVIYTFHMPLFFFISGYLVAFSLKRHDVPGVLKARAKGLMVPYLTWGTLGVATFYLLDMLEGKCADFHFGSEWFGRMIVAPEIWFLVTLFFCSVLLLSSFKLQERFGPGAFAIVYGALLCVPFNEYGALYYIKWFYVFYAAGYFVNRYGSPLIALLNRKSVLAFCFLLFVIFVPFWTKNDYVYVHKMNFLTSNIFVDITGFGYRYFLGFLGISIVFFGGAYLAKTVSSRIWAAIGVYSLDIYLLQRYFVEGLFPRLWVKTGAGLDAFSPFFLTVFAPVVTVIAIGLCIAVSKYLIRANPLLNMIFLGQRP